MNLLSFSKMSQTPERELTNFHMNNYKKFIINNNNASFNLSYGIHVFFRKLEER